MLKSFWRGEELNIKAEVDLPVSCAFSQESYTKRGLWKQRV